jgi:putative membrane-bound dehydrogenase-like protein
MRRSSLRNLPPKFALITTACLVFALAAPFCTFAAVQEAPARPQPQVPPGFTIERVAGSPLVERPIVASFDDQGRLYVAESSGTNADVETQLAELPHRVVRLDDEDGDGVFDRRTVYADKLMFPEGVCYLDGSVYVATPPSIWKLTDTDGDGVADERVEWHDGKTLTGCANDLHGPYRGPDGWLYWCKGAFAEQTHEVNGQPWKTRAAHIFRAQPSGAGFEPVLTGGMDNPVDVTFMPNGERILSATYLIGDGRRDGMVHAIYGGVYGKPHGVLDGHPRTGDLMPALVMTRATAPSGIERYDSSAFGPEYRDNIFLCHFNTRTVSRHILSQQGSTYASVDEPFVTCDDVDFHPTDVIVDADGSLIVIDTGGWYKLCCPTSQLWKPDILGGIYRVRREGAPQSNDPRGLQLAWRDLSPSDLWNLLSDSRLAVRDRAASELNRRRDDDDLEQFVAALLTKPPDDAAVWPTEPVARLARVWALARIASPDALNLVRQRLQDSDPIVRHASLHTLSLCRDKQATAALLRILATDEPHNQRVAAEALGRIGSRDAVPQLLIAAERTTDDRILRHSICFALLEIGDLPATRAGLASVNPTVVAVALFAVEQMPAAALTSDEIIPLLDSPDATVRDAARWVVNRHDAWGDSLADWFQQHLQALDAAAAEQGQQIHDFVQLLAAFSTNARVQQLLAEVASDASQSAPSRRAAIAAMSQAAGAELPASWANSLLAVLQQGDSALIDAALAAIDNRAVADELRQPLDDALAGLFASQQPQEIKIRALAARSAGHDATDAMFTVLVAAVGQDVDAKIRSRAADAISELQATPQQLERLCTAIKTAGPLEIDRLAAPFLTCEDAELTAHFLAALEASDALSALRWAPLRESLGARSPELNARLDALEARVNIDAAAQREQIDQLIPQIAQGDVRRGHAVFNSNKAACTTCHRMGLYGGLVGPDLSAIGALRTERDLLESILFPSLSFVRSYEPVSIVTTAGQAVSGVIRDENDAHIVLATNADSEATIERDDIESIEPNNVSVMPAGLDKVLTTQDLADLVAFLKSRDDQ